MDSPRDELIAALRVLMDDRKEDVMEIMIPGKFAGIGKVEFKSSEAMWTFPKANRGIKMQHASKELWHTIDRTMEERALVRKVMYVVKEFRLAARTQLGMEETDPALRTVVDGDSSRSIVCVRMPGQRPVRICQKTPGGDTLVIVVNWQNCGLNNINADTVVDDANNVDL